MVYGVWSSYGVGMYAEACTEKWVWCTVHTAQYNTRVGGFRGCRCKHLSQVVDERCR